MNTLFQKTDAHLPGLDGLRAFAVLIVVAFHRKNPAKVYDAAKEIFPILTMGIIFFFNHNNFKARVGVPRKD